MPDVPTPYFEVVQSIIDMVGDYSKKNPEKGKKIFNSFVVVLGGGTLCLGALMAKRFNDSTRYMMSTLAKAGLEDLKQGIEIQIKQQNARIKLMETELKLKETVPLEIANRMRHNYESDIKKFSDLLEEIKVHNKDIIKSVKDMCELVKQTKEN